MKKNSRGLLTRCHVSRTEGALLVELMFSVTIIAVGVLSYLLVTQKNLVAQREAIFQDKASVMFANTAEKLRQTDFDELYSTYANGYVADTTTAQEEILKTESEISTYKEKQYYLEDLKTSDGSEAEVLITFETNETKLRSEYGPVLDLDGDGSMGSTDIFSTGSPDILPTKMSVTFETLGGQRTFTKYVVIRR